MAVPPRKSKDKDQSWVLVQPGLFKYPLADNEQPALLASRCGHCRKTFFPKRALCPDCFDQGSLGDIALDSRGVIYASTVVHIPSPAGLTAPYAYGYVDIAANGVRVHALFTGREPHSFAPGLEVELVLEPIRVDSRGEAVIGYKFRPV